MDVRLFLNTEEGKEETVIHPTEHAWTGYKVTCEIRKPQKSLPESNFIAADVRHDAEFLSADSKKRGTIRR